MRRFLSALAFAAAVCATPWPAAADERMEAGFAAAEDYDYAQALDQFRAAGEAGNVQGARIAGLMLLYGEALYGPAVKQDRAAAVGLLKKAAAGGCEVSAAMLPKIARAGPVTATVVSAGR
ncbi:MAG: hypothetical protein MUC55_04300 [Burkholderiales bacterium]|jgi:TPR repeat protein|nr:hypothetical protein [Burkholderiales bacterium]